MTDEIGVTTLRSTDSRKPGGGSRLVRGVGVVAMLGLVATLVLGALAPRRAFAGTRDYPNRYDLSVTADGHVMVRCRIRLSDYAALRLLLGPDAFAIQDLRATNETGRDIPLRAVRHGEWTLSPQARTPAPRTVLTLQYRLRLPRRGREHFTVAPARCLIYATELARKRSRIRVVVPSDWAAATALKTVGRATDTRRSPKKGGDVFEAATLARLLDSPILVGRSLVRSSFNVGKTRFWLVFSQRPKEANAFEKGLKRIAAYQLRLFGDRRPFSEYTFLVSLDASSSFDHHRNTTSIALPELACASESKLAGCLLEVAEGMVRPWLFGAPATPDVTRRTRSAWFARGASRYYALRSLQKTRMIDDALVLNAIAKHWVEIDKQSLRESAAALSWREAEERSPRARRMSMALGTVLAFVLDGEIRKRTEGEASLDDVMRRLTSTWFDRRGNELTNQRIERAISQVVKGDFSDYFRKYVEGDTAPTFKRTLEDLGYQMVVLAEELPSASLFLKTLRRATRSGHAMPEISDGSWLHSVGFRSGDRLTSIHGLDVRSRGFSRAFMRKVRAAAKAGRPLRSIDVVVKRRRRTVRLTVNLPSRQRAVAACELTGDPVNAALRGWSVAKPK